MILIIGGAFQGKKDFAKNVLKIKEEKIFDNFHIEVKKYIDNPEELLKKIFDGDYEAVISDEIGCGIVPLDKENRRWREIVGRNLCILAKKSKQVWRVQCGIGVMIKGE